MRIEVFGTQFAYYLFAFLYTEFYLPLTFRGRRRGNEMSYL
jgi:hypothetical protein